MQYFIDYIIDYSSVNNKGHELQTFVRKFNQCLIPDELSLDAMKAEIEHEIERLNKAYPRTRPLVLSVYSGKNFSQWKVHAKGNADKVVFFMSCKAIVKTFLYSEHLPVKLIKDQNKDEQE